MPAARLAIAALVVTLLIALAPRVPAADDPPRLERVGARPRASTPPPVEYGAAEAVIEKGLHPRWRPTALRVALEHLVEP